MLASKQKVLEVGATVGSRQQISTVAKGAGAGTARRFPRRAAATLEQLLSREMTVQTDRGGTLRCRIMSTTFATAHARDDCW